ncbi:protein of unknown function [Salegentibacter echinorum]|uniref:DUF4878 domain-containing protein n=1 Tax=Salegentibacter echinorum TaxID=1073325 RepID=A0A1M5K859_SALEC|nr:DUF4878 domain-containing protein [Salegentibacter echinorum]SHG48760.1 protein of unknown function [Salegentibacter echinorum]
MKKFVIYSVILFFVSCAEEKNNSPSETAKIVAESFYQGDKTTLKKYTTEEGFANFSSIQHMFSQPKDSEANFRIIDQKTENDVAWIKYETSYDKKPGIFKLVKVDNQWKVTARRPREKMPF